MNLGLDGNHVLVTGASGGIGYVLTQMLLDEGANVTAVYRSHRQTLESLGDKWKDQLLTERADLLDERDIESLFEKANEAFGRVDSLVTNAGISEPQGVAVQDMSLEQWNKTIGVNLTGSFLCAKHFFRNLERYPSKSASLVLVGSTAGEFGEAWYSDYSTSKAGLSGLLLSLKNEIVHVAPRGRVNLVNPGGH